MSDNIVHLFGPEKESVSVLLVDDQEMFRDLARSVLEKGEDYRVIGEAGGGIEAIKRTGELRPDVVIMDIQMPDMSGIEATREILSSYPGTQVVLMSMGSDSEYPSLVRAIGANGFLTKRNVTPENLDMVLGLRDMPDTLAA
jgi:DNA-binding NarL/FixJ family response regulator